MRNNIPQRIILFLTFLLTLTLWSCASQKQAEKRYNKSLNIVRGDMNKFLDACDIAFPRVSTQYIKGDVIVQTDTIEVPGPIIECPKPTKENPKPAVKCPPNKIIDNSTQRVDTIKVADTRELSKLKSEIQTLENYIIELKNSNKDCEKTNKDLSKQYLDTKEDLIKKTSTQYYGWIAFGLLTVSLIGYKVTKSRFIQL
ncbi:hypothetical protein [Empedobacter sp.]|uniref:hypothetical protein n=1 Tax=Empedobacter sp. TaxID=1927715 RepID=UPI00289A5710|nr:hypothetical protein [Empedobacter sp.]